VIALAANSLMLMDTVYLTIILINIGTAFLVNMLTAVTIPVMLVIRATARVYIVDTAAAGGGITAVRATHSMTRSAAVSVSKVVSNGCAAIAAKGASLIMAGGTSTHIFQIASFGFKVIADAAISRMCSCIVACVRIPVVAIVADVNNGRIVFYGSFYVIILINSFVCPHPSISGPVFIP
jgi:hypothetical protein